MALQRQRRTQEAISAYTRALEFGTPTTTLLLNLADAHAYLGRRAEALGYFRNARTLAEAGLKVNLQDSAQRAMLAYCLGQIGDRRLAEYEIGQALQHSPDNKDVRRFGVLTYESMGQRDRALEILRGSRLQLLEELESAWGTEQLRADPRYEEVARYVRSK